MKTKLSSKNLRDGLQILWNTFRDRQTVLPVFKGIFAFEAGIRSSLQLALLGWGQMVEAGPHGLILTR